MNMKIVLVPKMVLHVSDVASLIGCSACTVYKLIESGKLRAYKTGRAWKINAEDLLDYLESRSQKANA